MTGVAWARRAGQRPRLMFASPRVVVILTMLEGMVRDAFTMDRSVLVTVYQLATVVLAIAGGVRRMHDPVG